MGLASPTPQWFVLDSDDWRPGVAEPSFTDVLDVLMTIDEPDLFYLYEDWCDAYGGQRIWQMDDFPDVVGDKYYESDVQHMIANGGHFIRDDFYFYFDTGRSVTSFDDLLDYMLDECSSELEDMAQYVIDNDNPTDIWEIDDILHPEED